MSSCSSEGGGVGAHRVSSRTTPRGARPGAFYFGDASFRSGGSGFGFGSATAATTPEEASRACSQRNVSEDTAPAPPPGAARAAPALRGGPCALIFRRILGGGTHPTRAEDASPPTTSASAAEARARHARRPVSRVRREGRRLGIRTRAEEGTRGRDNTVRGTPDDGGRGRTAAAGGEGFGDDRGGGARAVVVPTERVDDGAAEAPPDERPHRVRARDARARVRREGGGGGEGRAFSAASRRASEGPGEPGEPGEPDERRRPITSGNLRPTPTSGPRRLPRPRRASAGSLPAPSARLVSASFAKDSKPAKDSKTASATAPPFPGPLARRGAGSSRRRIFSDEGFIGSDDARPRSARRGGALPRVARRLRHLPRPRPLGPRGRGGGDAGRARRRRAGRAGARGGGGGGAAAAAAAKRSRVRRRGRVERGGAASRGRARERRVGGGSRPATHTKAGVAHGSRELQRG